MERDHRGGIDRRSLGLGLAGLGAATLASPAWPQGMPAVQDVPAARPESVGMSGAALAKIAEAMKAHVEAGKVQGAVTAVARRGKLVHFQAHGWQDIEAKTPMRTDSLFVMMSSTKPVTGVALLQQIEAGKVSLDDKVSKFIPEVKDLRVRIGPAPNSGPPAIDGPPTPPPPPGPPPPSEPASREITIRDLATHTSGLNASILGRGQTLATTMPALKDVLLDFQPGSRWAYSATTGPDVLARIVEIVSGEPFDQYLRNHITGPIGMSETAHNLTPAQVGRLVTRYQRTDAGAWAKARGADRPPAPTTYYAGGFGLMSTARDYLLFETMLLNKGTIHGKRVLKPESVELMRRNLVGDLYKGIRGATKGTGFGVLVRTVLDPATCGCNREMGAFGWEGAYGTMTWTDPKRELVAVVMLQQNNADVKSDFERLVREAVVA